jgi:hypothetical protein
MPKGKDGGKVDKGKYGGKMDKGKDGGKMESGKIWRKDLKHVRVACIASMEESGVYEA